MAVTFKGGGRLNAFLRRTKDHQRAPLIEVGFKDRRIAVLAGRLEFGMADDNLPERPAFRNGVDEANKRVKAYAVRAARENLSLFFGLTREQWRELAIVARDAIRESYLNFSGPGLSERQKARKRGSRYADDELIGAEGPKLIQHIHAYVDGERV